MSAGGQITLGILILVITAVVMTGVGQTFDDDLEENTAQDGVSTVIEDADCGIIDVACNFGNFLKNTFLADTIDGYGIFPAWINIILFTIPLVLILRGIFSTSA